MITECNVGRDKILFVDDEKSILDSVKREFFDWSYQIVTASSGKDGLTKLAQEGPFAVVVSDMRMPEMDGVGFLSKVKELYPESVRIMLTGNLDVETAVAAVNEGNIFRFITKPCRTETLIKVVDAALQQYHLMRVERELLEDTLQGGVNVLVEMLALTSPHAFSRSKRIAFFVRQLAEKMSLIDIWQYEMAAMLSQIGCVTIPPDVLEKSYRGQPLSPVEQAMVEKYPAVGHDLIVKIPRLETVAKIIADQRKNFTAAGSSQGPALMKVPAVEIGSALLRAAIDLDSFLYRGLTHEQAVKKMGEDTAVYHPQVVELLSTIRLPAMERKRSVVQIKDLRKGMVLAEDIVTKNGLLLVKQGQEISLTMVVMLQNHLRRENIEDGIPVALAG